MIVSTCNRVELVAAGKGLDSDLRQVSEACAAALCKRAPVVRDHLYRFNAGAAVRHLFRVAASLDSLVLGEPQILGQLKDAYELARQQRSLGPILNRTLPRALRAAKRVRTETSIGSGQVSVPSVAVDLARQIFGELSGRSVMLVGSGDMAETAARQLRGAGARVVVVGRNLERAQEVAQAVEGKARPWSELVTTLSEADVVLSSTSAEGFVIDHDSVAAARKRRRGHSQFLIDLAVPRDIEPRVEKLDGVFLYNIDDLSKVVEGSRETRSREAERAEAIILSEALGYDRWADAELATPTIVALRGRLRSALETELQRSLRGRLRHLPEDDRNALGKMLDASVNRLLHGPTLRLRKSALARGSDSLTLEQLAAALEELFELAPGDPSFEEVEAALLRENSDAGQSSEPRSSHEARQNAPPASDAGGAEPRENTDPRAGAS
jgi:glutamyl-tRNA reductase